MKRYKQHALVVITHQKPTIINHDLYKLQSMNLDATHEHLEQFRETKCF